MNSKIIGKWFAIVGSVLLCALPVGFIGSIFSLISAFNKIVEYGTSDSAFVASEISSALVAIVLGLVISLPGVILVGLAITVFKYREPWVYWLALFALILVILHFPIGTVLGLVLLTILLVKRRLFLDHGAS